MSEDLSPKESSEKLRTRIINSRLAGWIANLPPIAWLTQIVMRPFIRRSIRSHTVGEELLGKVAGVGLEATLNDIAKDVVDTLGYVAAMVATYEQGDALPVRAFYMDPKIAPQEKIIGWEKQISDFAGKQVSISDPEIAPKVSVAYRYNPEFKENLSVLAIEAEKPVVSDELYALFTPVAPESSRPTVEVIQQELGIHQVIAVPFFIETIGKDEEINREVVGNLFAARNRAILDKDILTLSAFGRLAANAIENEKRRLQNKIVQDFGLAIQSNLEDQDEILELIAKGVVERLGYLAAMVATYEQGDALPVRAFYMDPKIAPQEKIIGWEKQISDFAGKQVSISDPEIAPKVSVAYRYNPEFKENLSVLAIEAEKPVVSDELYALFTPVAPESSRPTVEVIQQELGIHQVIAVPFFIETIGKDEEINREVVGNLFTVSRSRSFSIREIEMLETFGQQAAIGIHNAKLYRDRAEALRKSEARREIAQIFAKTAFFANTAVHQLNNSIGGAYNDLKEIHNAYLSSDYESVKGIFDDIFADLDDAKACIKDLDDPFRDIPDDPIDVNKAIARATRKVKHLGQVNISGCANELPKVLSSVPVLSEVFGIFFKNGLEAMHKKLPNKNFANELRVCSSYDKDKEKIIVTIEDTGVGIEPEHMDHIFEHRWTTKEAEGGFGFGLFLARDIIVENLGGSIEVNSERGRGTTFYVTLPVIKMT